MPKKPTKVDVHQLNAALTRLKQLQTSIKNAGPGDMTAIAGSGIYDDLISADGKGIQDVHFVQTVDERYSNCAQWITTAHTNFASGVDTLVLLIQQTVNAHSKSDDDTKNSADATGGGAGSNASSTQSAPTSAR